MTKHLHKGILFINLLLELMIIKMKRLCYVTVIMLCTINTMAHGSLQQHGEDIMAVLGFEICPENFKLFVTTSPQKNNSWTKFISTDMIDDKVFHKKLEERHPNFKISSPNKHRLLFHWPYNAIPWTPELERHIRTYCRTYHYDVESTIRTFKKEIKTEQVRRNKKMIEVTEKVFGFAHGGIESNWTLFFVAMAYNVHLLGDQQSDNSVFAGVADVNNLIGQIILTLRLLDKAKCKPLEREITLINKKYTNPQEKADALMKYLKLSVPSFIKKTQNGIIARRIERRGFKFK